MGKLLILVLFSISSSLFAQTLLTIEGTNVNSTVTGNWLGVNIARSSPTTFTFRNNSVTSVNASGYMLQAGDEVEGNTNNNLDGSVITGNRFTWNGTPGSSITHGLFTAFNKNDIIKYNFLNKVPYGVASKSGTDAGINMTNESGGIAYNIIKNSRIGIRIKGINGTKIYNNTFYISSPYYTGLAYIFITSNDDMHTPSPSLNTKIFNNIFYSTGSYYNIYVAPGSEMGFESDYNVFYSEAGTPVFNYKGKATTFAQWQALGYDTHSVIVNPNFTNTNDLVPTTRLNYGTNLGSTWQTGLSTTATWAVNSSPATANQNGTWQVGARIFADPGSAILTTDFKIDGRARATTITTNKGTLQMLVTDIAPLNATDKTVNWSVVNGTGTATIDNSGLLTATTNGTVTVWGYAHDASGAYDSKIITISNQGNGAVYYVATNGSNSNSGSISNPWATWQYGFSQLSAGDILYIRGGTYTGLLGNYGSNYFGVRVNGENGTSNNHIIVSAYNGEEPILDGSSLTSTTGQNVGIAHYNCSYWDLIGLKVSNFIQASDNSYPAPGWYGSNVSHITHNLCTNYHCGDGFTLVGTHDYIYYTNCDSYENADRYTAGGQLAGGLCNGFYATPDAGEHVYYIGCRAWNNSDDGWDTFNSNGGYIEFDNCWAFDNGWYLTTVGDGSGFKLGVIKGKIESGVQRTLKNCMAFGNLGPGFDQNSGGYGTIVRMTLYNCTSASNQHGAFQFYYDNLAVIRNCISYNETRGDVGNGIHDHNSWQNGLSVSGADFLSSVTTQAKDARQSDGSLPDNNFLHLASGSDLIDSGIDVGSPYHGSAPDLGAFEFISNNQLPSILNQNFQLDKNSLNGTIVGTMAASDQDTDQTLTYSIVLGNTNGAFAINDSTGVLSVANDAALSVDFALVVKVKDNGVGELSSQAIVAINIIPTGIELTGNKETIKVYPNPVSDILIIEIEGNKDRTGFEILNSIGQIVFKGTLSDKTVVQTINFSPGVYFVKIAIGSSFEFKKIVKI